MQGGYYHARPLHHPKVVETLYEASICLYLINLHIILSPHRPTRTKVATRIIHSTPSDFRSREAGQGYLDQSASLLLPRPTPTIDHLVLSSRLNR